jgi:hypothetical protein
MKVFWSWQSDTPGKIGRHFVRDALNAAIERLKQTPEIEEPTSREARSAMHLDQDRKGISGSPDLARVILEKIEQAAVFVADVTSVGITTTTTQKNETEPKKIINPNVAIELGYALHALGDRALLMVMNEHYGSRADLPFDLQSKAGPIMFTLSPDADRKTIAAALRQLTAQLAEALELCIAQHVETVRRQTPFPEAELKDGPARFRAPGQALGIRNPAGFGDPGGTIISLAPGPAMWLRLMPPFDQGKKLKIPDLGKALNQGINLPTLIGPANGTSRFRADDGVGICVLFPDEVETKSAAFAFKTGEVWAIDTWLLRAEQTVLLDVEIEKSFTEQLPRYGRFLTLLGLNPPYRWIAGLTGVQNRHLQFPRARYAIPGMPGPICASEHVISEGSYDGKQSPMSTLLPFFKDIYEACGIERPAHLPQS